MSQANSQPGAQSDRGPEAHSGRLTTHVLDTVLGGPAVGMHIELYVREATSDGCANGRWLSLRSEPVLDADRPIIDAHHHLWDKPGSRYLGGEMMEDVAAGHHVVATVFAEGKTGYRVEGDPHLRSLGETEMATAIAVECLD